MTTGRRRAITSPPAGAPQVGLIVSARTTFPGEDDRWESGISYEPECVPSTGDPMDFCDPAAVDDPVANAIVEWDAYGIQAGYRCSTSGFRGKDWQGIARRRLLADEERQISAELWRGALSRSESYPNLFLASRESSDTLTDGPTSLTDALACLEEYIKGCNGGQQGMIHATSQTVTHWMSFGNLLYRKGNVIYTSTRDTIVVPGAGYDGSAPANEGGADTPRDAAEGSIWAYATGVVDVRRGEIQVLGDPMANPEQVDRTTNTVRVIAQRAALASWDGCCHGAVEVDLSLCSMGGVS